VAASGARAAMARESTGNAMKGITEWLASIGLSEYAQRFADNAIDLSVLRDLTEQDLKDLGVLLGHRRKMLRAIAELEGTALAPTETATESARADPVMADIVAKVFLHRSPKILRAVDARYGGPHRPTINSRATSVRRLRLQRSPGVDRIDLWWENYRRAISDFCNNIGTTTRVHHAARQHGRVAARGPCAAADAPVIGYLGTTTADDFASRLAAFREGLKQVGYIEGRNVAIEYRWPEGRYDRLPMLVADLVRRQVAVIAAVG
jgi:hypothetical protein